MGIAQAPISESDTIAFFGGTFDPIHLGHIDLANAAAAEFQCKVRMVVNATPPHRKPPHAAWTHRKSMCEQATAHNPNIIIGDEESPKDDNAPHYTIDTLAALKQRQKKILLLIGMDSLLNFKTWHRWQDIFALANIAAAHRGGYEANIPKDFKPRLVNKTQLSKQESGGIFIWDYHPPTIAAATLRQQLSKAQPKAAAYLHPTTQTYIQQHNLYNA